MCLWSLRDLTMEANVFCFRVFFDTKGMLHTELSGIPIEEVSKIGFDKDDEVIIRKIVNECRTKFSSMHEYLQNEIQALNHHE